MTIYLQALRTPALISGAVMKRERLQATNAAGDGELGIATPAVRLTTVTVTLRLS